SYPDYWFRPPRTLSGKAGMQRWTMELRYAPPAGFPRSYPMTAIYRDTPPQPDGPLIHPGEYQIRLTVDGKQFTQPLRVKLDPRVTSSPEAIAAAHNAALACYDSIAKVRAAQADVRRLREQLKARKEQTGAGELGNAIDELDKTVAVMEGRTAGLDF